jgi:hypothetical protein
MAYFKKIGISIPVSELAEVGCSMSWGNQEQNIQGAPAQCEQNGSKTLGALLGRINTTRN